MNPSRIGARLAVAEWCLTPDLFPVPLAGPRCDGSSSKVSMTVTMRTRLLPGFSTRALDAELMDNPASDGRRLLRTVGQFRVINRLVSRSRGLAERYIVAPMMREPSRSYSVLDIGAGGGDFALWLVQTCSRRGLRVTVECIDSDPRVVAFAGQACAGVDAISVRFADAVDNTFPLGDHDFVFANHLLHHLAACQVSIVVRRAYDAARMGLLFNDLVRSAANYLVYTALCPILFRDSFAFHDGRLSIRKGFTVNELAGAVEEAGLEGKVRVGKTFPGRVYLYADKTARRASCAREPGGAPCG